MATWTIKYAKENYLRIYQEECPNDLRLNDIIFACEKYLNGDMKLNEVKTIIKEASQIARDATSNIIAQVAARAISTACSTIQTPTSALGFLFYGAATIAYSEVGLTETAEVYDRIATLEFKKALSSLQKVAIPNEPYPVKIKWNC